MDILEEKQTIKVNSFYPLSDEAIMMFTERIISKVSGRFKNVKLEISVISCIVRSVDRELYQHLPADYYKQLIKDRQRLPVITTLEIESRIIPIVLSQMYYPQISDFQKEFLVQAIVHQILNVDC